MNLPSYFFVIIVIVARQFSTRKKKDQILKFEKEEIRKDIYEAQRKKHYPKLTLVHCGG